MTRLAAPEAKRTRLSGRIRHFEPPLRPAPRGPEYTELETADGRRVFLHRDVLEDLAVLERAEHPNESAGLLFGRVFTDGTNQCALVRHLIPPLRGEVIGTRATVTITAEGSSRMSERAQHLYPCADAVGWAHTHPTFNAYFSGTDREEQAVWTSPASVGLVISGLDAARPPFEVYVGPESQPTRVVGRARWSTPRASEERRIESTVGPPPSAERQASVPPELTRNRRELIAAAAAAAVVLVVIVCALLLGESGPRYGGTAPSVAALLEAEGDGLAHTASVTAGSAERTIADLLAGLAELDPGRALDGSEAGG